MRFGLAFILFLLGAGAVSADNAALPEVFSKYADPESVVLAVQSEFDVPGGLVRLVVYDREDAFLGQAAAKYWAKFDDGGIAVLPLRALEPGAYAFIVYLDVNQDGKLNRSALGRPTEPVAFSNGFRPRLQRPKFDDVKITVDHGSVVVMILD